MKDDCQKCVRSEKLLNEILGNINTITEDPLIASVYDRIIFDDNDSYGDLGIIGDMIETHFNILAFLGERKDWNENE